MGFFLKIVINIDLLGNRFYKFTVEYQSNLSYQITKKKKTANNHNRTNNCFINDKISCPAKLKIGVKYNLI